MAQEVKFKFRADVDFNSVIKQFNVLLSNLKSSLGAFGKTVTLVDETKIKRELDAIKLSFDNTEASVKKIGTETDKLADGLKRAADKGSLLGKAFQFNQIAQSMNLVVGAMDRFVQPYVELDKQVKNIGTLLAGSGRDFKEFAQLTTELSKTVPSNAAEIAQGAYQTISAGIGNTNEEVIKFTETAAKAAVAGLATTEAAVDGLSSVLNAFKNSTGDAKLSLEDTNKVADTFFAAIKLGKTDFNQMNAAIASWVPSAAALGLSFEQGAAAIANLTAQGTPTAQVGTQLNALFTLVQKGTGPLNKALEATGTNLKELQEKMKKPVAEGGGLVAVMKTIQDAAEKTGQSVVNLTGRVEAAKLIQSLAGSEDKVRDSFKTYEDLLTEIANGAASTAYEVAAEGIEVRTKVFLNKIQAGFSEFFGIIGTGAVTALNSVAQLGPALSAFAGLGQILPTKQALEGIKSLPKLFSSALIPVSKLSATITTLVPGFTAVVPAATAAGAAGVASGTATATAWMTALAPIMAIIAAVGLLVAAFIYLYKNVEPFKEFIDGMVEVGEYGFKRLGDIISIVADILLAFGSAVFESITLPIRLAAEVIGGIVDTLFDLTGEALTAEDVINALGKAFDFVILTLNAMKATVTAAVASIKSISAGVIDVIDKLMKGDFKGAIAAFGDLGKKAAQEYKEKFENTMGQSNFTQTAKKLDEVLNRDAEFKIEVKEFSGIDKLIEQYKTIEIEIDVLKSKAPEELTKEEQEQLAALEKKAEQTAEQIGKLAPEAKKNMRAVVDETGVIREVYDINIEKAEQFAEAQQKLYDSQLTESQEDYSKNLMTISDELEKQKRQLDEKNAKLVQLAQEGKQGTAEYRNQTKEIQEQSKKIEENKNSLINYYQQGARNGLLTEQAAEKIGKRIGLNNEGIQQATNLQADFTAEVENTEEAARSLGGAFEEAMSKAKQSQTEAIGALAELKRQLKAGEISQEDYNKKRKETLDEGKKAVKEVLYLTELEKQAKRELGIVEGQKATAVASSLQNAKKLFDQEKKSIQNTLEQKRIIEETNRLENEREKTIVDEISAQKDKVASLEAEKQKLIEIYRLNLDNQGLVVDVGIKLNKNEKKDEVIADINNQITQLNNEIAKEKNKDIELSLRAKLDDAELQKKLDELSLAQLRYEVEIGIASPEDLVSRLKSDYSKIADTISEEQNKLDNLMSQLSATKGDEDLSDERRRDIEAEIRILRSKLVDLKKAELGARSEIFSEEKTLREKRLRMLEEQHNKEMQLVDKRAQAELSITRALIGASASGMSRYAEIEQQKKLDNLERLRENEMLSEIAFKRQKEDLEREHYNRIQTIQAAARGAELEAQRQHELRILEQKRKAAQEKLSQLDPIADKEAFEAAQSQFDELNNLWEEKGDLLLVTAEAMQENMSEIFSSMFDGGEAMKDSARKMFAEVAGILKTAASATVTKLVLDQLMLTGGGLGALVAAAVIRGLVSGAINKILEPILAQLTSFSTGGRVDSPTIAVVGDASRSRPGSNTEWILRDDHMWFIFAEAMRRQEPVLRSAISFVASEMVREMQDIGESLNMDTLIDLLQMDTTPEKHLQQLEIVNMGLERINEGLQAIESELHTKLTSDKTFELLMDMNKLMRMQIEHNSGRITDDEYLRRYGQTELKLRSYASGSGFINKPQMAIIGDAGQNNPEIVLNNPQLQALIQEASRVGNEKVEKMLGELINVVENIDWDVYISSDKITDSVNRINNQRKARIT
jgi:TP901 family phage tail tape measure protein